MSVEFEPVKLGQRRRRLDALSISAVAVALAVGAAILKPWGGGPSSGTVDERSPAAAASGGLTGPHATASVALARIPARTASSPRAWAEIGPVINRHELWGIRAVVVAAQGYSERWVPLPSHSGQAPTVQVDPGDRSIVAIGVTFPTSHTPLDARIWRLGPGGLEWVDTEALDSVPSGGAFLYVQPGVAGSPIVPWSAGSYRVDVLVDGTIRRLGFTIPNRFSNVPEPSGRPALRDIGRLIDPSEVSLPDVPIGLFATVDRLAVPMPADEGAPLDEASAWLDVDPGTRRAPRSFVAAAYLPRATGLGVMLPPRSVVMSATMTRLAPEPQPTATPLVDHTPRDGAPSSHVLFRAADGGVWAPGVYRLSIVWADSDGLHDQSWHAELRPGPARVLSSLLAAARGWARYAGGTGVILGTAEPLEGGPRAAAIRLLRLRPTADPPYPAATGVGCGGTVVEGRPGILGFAYPADHYASTASARILLPFTRREDRVVLTSAFGVRGLILVAPARSPTLPAATYRFTVGQGRGAQVYALCLGMAAFDD